VRLRRRYWQAETGVPPDSVNVCPLIVHVTEHEDPCSEIVHDAPCAEPPQLHVLDETPPASCTTLQQAGALELELLEHAAMSEAMAATTAK
jgi:hypothetical protein